VCQDLVDRPLIVGVAAVLGREHRAVGRDQEVGGQPEPSAGLLQRRPAEPAQRRHHNAAHDRRPTPRIGQGAGARLDAELAVDHLVRVGNGRERQISGVLGQFVGRRVEEHHLSDGGALDLVVAIDERPQMQVADRAAGEPAKLQVHQPFGIGDRYEFTGHAAEFDSVDGGGRVHGGS